MTDEREIEHKFWKALKSDRTIMLGIVASADDAQPMTALTEGDDERGPLWIFSAKDVDLVRAIGAGQRGMAQFVSKGHDVFASLVGDLSLENNRSIIERLWNPYVAAWYEGGKDDPKLQLIRFDPEHARVWLNENSLSAGVKLMLGQDPKEEYADKVADLDLESRSPNAP
jgi:general stress protein 26